MTDFTIILPISDSHANFLPVVLSSLPLRHDHLQFLFWCRESGENRHLQACISLLHSVKNYNAELVSDDLISRIRHPYFTVIFPSQVIYSSSFTFSSSSDVTVHPSVIRLVDGKDFITSTHPYSITGKFFRSDLLNRKSCSDLLENDFLRSIQTLYFRSIIQDTVSFENRSPLLFCPVDKNPHIIRGDIPTHIIQTANLYFTLFKNQSSADTSMPAVKQLIDFTIDLYALYEMRDVLSIRDISPINDVIQRHHCTLARHLTPHTVSAHFYHNEIIYRMISSSYIFSANIIDFLRDRNLCSK